MNPGTLKVSTPTTAFTLEGDRSYVVGRGRGSDVVVADSRVSRSHVSLEPGAGGWVARDTSANGMWQDGRRVATATIDGETVRLHLGAADGPEIVLVRQRPAGQQPADPEIDQAATMLAPAGGRVTPGAATPRRGAPPAPAPAPVPAAAADSPPDQPSAALRWLRLLPTMLWLAATGFALGALIALS